MRRLGTPTRYLGTAPGVLPCPPFSRPCGLLSSTGKITEYVDMAWAQDNSPSHHRDVPGLPWALPGLFRGPRSRPSAWNTVPRDEPGPERSITSRAPSDAAYRPSSTLATTSSRRPLDAGCHTLPIPYPIDQCHQPPLPYRVRGQKDIRRHAHEVPVTDSAHRVPRRKGWVSGEEEKEGKGCRPAAGIRDRSAGTGNFPRPGGPSFPRQAKPLPALHPFRSWAGAHATTRALSHPPCRAGGIETSLHGPLPGGLRVVMSTCTEGRSVIGRAPCTKG